jgi:hypothetical protein
MQSGHKRAASKSVSIVGSTDYHEIEASTSASPIICRPQRPFGLRTISTTFVFNCLLLFFLLLTSTIAGAQSTTAGDQINQNGRTRVGI